MRNELLKTILAQPSAPFRERHVIREITQALTEGKVPWFADKTGNLVVGAKSEREYKQILNSKDREPVRVFIAHMDHPGFHGVKWRSDTELEVKWHGGSPTQHLQNSKVWIADGEGARGEGHFQDVKMIPSGRAIDSGVVHVSSSIRVSVTDASKLYGGLAIRAPSWEENEIIYTKAADDLVGSFAIVSLGLDLYAKKRAKRAPFIGLLTRAEEVGFIGAIGHFEEGWLQKAKRSVVCVSLETSRTLPGAEIGKGPVVRQGDKTGVFHSGALRVFTQQALRALPDAHQKRVMDGGTCEATAATAYGLSCVGISVPLGNYHNQSFEGGPDAAPSNGPAPEFVHRRDLAGLLSLCHALLEPGLPWAEPWKEKLKEFKKDLKDYRPLLRSGP